MNLLNGASVCPGFRFRDDPEDFLCQITRTSAHIAPVDDGADIGKIPVCVRVNMLMLAVPVMDGGHAQVVVPVVMLMVMLMLMVMVVIVMIVQNTSKSHPSTPQEHFRDTA